MKKMDYKKLAIMGLAGGFALASQSINAMNGDNDEGGEKGILIAGHGCGSACQHRGYAGDPPENANMPMQHHSMMTERNLMEKLSPEGRRTYASLSPAGKALALKLANQTGPGEYGGPWADKDEAVRMAQMITEKKASQGRPGNSNMGGFGY